MPAPDELGMALVWQDGEAILLQRFSRDCESVHSVLEVNATGEFWRHPATTGLQDAAGLAGGGTVVAWTAGGEVWTRLVYPDAIGAAVRASGPGKFERTEVRIATKSSDRTFVVIWSSWEQDGDGWGVFARLFAANGQPIGEERQVNVGWRHFQWQPQVTWCGDSLWALWTNGTMGGCHDGRRYCASGPFIRRLTAGGIWAPGEEVSLHGEGPVTAGFACSGRSPESEAVAVLWLQRGGREVRWEYIQSRSALQLLSRLFSHRRLEAELPGIVGEQEPQFQANGQLLPWMLQARSLFGATEDAVATPAATLVAENSVATEEASQGAVDAGQVALLAHSGLMMILTRNRVGALGAQLMSYGASPRPLAFRRRDFAAGGRLARSAWDTTSLGELAFVSCWAAGGGFEADDSPVFECARHSVRWFVGASVLPGIGSVLAISTVLSLLYGCCCLGRCSQLLCATSWNVPLFRGQRIGNAARRIGARQTRLRRLHEVREQLAQIPGSAAAALRAVRTNGHGSLSDAEEAQAMPDDEDGSRCALAPQQTLGSEGRQDAAAGSDSDTEMHVKASLAARDACSICQEEVAVWVALRPCGHTACRDCTLRLAETSQKCHICRQQIKGVQPVYI